MPETESLPIEKSKPQGETHALAHQGVLEIITDTNKAKQEIVPLAKYLKDFAGKPRGNQTGGKEDLNSHNEEFIIRNPQGISVTSLSELQFMLKEQGLDIEILGVSSIGNKNQMVTAVVQGVNKDNPQSGYERPTVAEGPHMILAPYAVDKKGEMHLFRTIQMRTGEAVIDTPRGFAKDLLGGQMYDVENEGENVQGSMKKIVSEETGDALKIKRVTYLGAPRVNSSFVTSRSAVFGVEVDYEAFLKNKKVVTEEEYRRRNEQFQHEGLVGGVLDIPLSEYVNYKRDSEISKDMAADFGTDTVVMDFLAQKLGKAQRILSKQGEIRRKFKQDNPEGYVEHMLKESQYRYPEIADENQRRAEIYLSKLYRDSLKPKE